MRGHQLLQAIANIYAVVQNARATRAGARLQRQLLVEIEGLEDCFRDLEDPGCTDDDKDILDDALWYCQRANALVAELRRTGVVPEEELAENERLLDRAGEQLCDELFSLDRASGRRYPRFH